MNSLEMWGHKARVVIELDIGEGRTVSVPITEDCVFRPGAGGYGELKIAIRGGLETKVVGALDDVAFKGFDR